MHVTGSLASNVLLFDQPNPAALPFRSHQDALDFASHGAEHVNRVLAADNLVNIVERYRKGELEIKLSVNIGRVGNAGEYQLVFFAVPSQISTKELDAASSDSGISTHADTASEGERVKQFVFRGVTKLVHCPEGVIPSFVRLESSEEVTDFRWQVLAASGQIVPHISFSWAEGELSRFRVGTPGMLTANCESSLVKDRSEIVSAIKDDVGKVFCKWFTENDFENLTNSIFVFLSDWGPWLELKGVDLPFQISKVVLCSTEHPSRAFEDVSHW
jgi:hypothetical protein